MKQRGRDGGLRPASSTREDFLNTAKTLDEFLHEPRVGYFSMEIALRSEIPTYAGGLGILAGDTLRSAADLSLPLVAVSLVSRASQPDADRARRPGTRRAMRARCQDRSDGESRRGSGGLHSSRTRGARR
jgi:hypothetical protein